MKINNIKKLSSGKYKLTLDNDDKIVTYDDVILKNNLLYNKDIDTDMLQKLNTDTAYYDVYNKVINCISIRLRSLKEINDYLNRFSLSPKDNNTIIDNLKKIGLINDEAFLKAYISDKIHLTNSGPHKIRRELLDHDIEPELIDIELSKIEPEIIKDKVIHEIQKRIKTNHKHSNYMLKQKLLVDLINLGYDRDLISDVFDSFKSESNDILINTYDKLYDQLSEEYSGYELANKIKQKLYQKGFNMSEINEFLSTRFDN